MLGIAAARQGFRDKVISNIGFVRSNNNIADVLTKPTQREVLRDALTTGKMNLAVKQRIIRQ